MEHYAVSAVSAASADQPLHAGFGIESEQSGEDVRVFEDSSGVVPAV